MSTLSWPAGGWVQISTALTQSSIYALSLTPFIINEPGIRLSESMGIRPPRTGRYFRRRLDREAGVGGPGRRGGCPPGRGGILDPPAPGAAPLIGVPAPGAAPAVALPGEYPGLACAGNVPGRPGRLLDRLFTAFSIASSRC